MTYGVQGTEREGVEDREGVGAKVYMTLSQAGSIIHFDYAPRNDICRRRRKEGARTKRCLIIL